MTWVPAFDLQGGMALEAARVLLVSALISVFGTLTFRCVVAPKAFARMAPEAAAAQARLLLVLARASALAGVAACALWLLLQAGTMASAGSLAAAAAAVPAVLCKTSFGHVIAAQCAMLVVVLVVLGWRDSTARQRIALGVAGLALALQAGHSHAFSMHEGPSLLLACDVMHLLGAGAWLGGLVPLLLVVLGAPPRAAVTAARWFSPLGQVCIAALVLSAAVQAWVLVATIPGLVGTAYGWMIFVKLALFGVLLGFACANRYRCAPALMRGDGVAGRRVLVRSIALQTGAAIAIVLAAAVLSALPPAMHEQAGWPFAWRFSLAAVTEDADFRREVILAGLAVGAAVLVLCVALALRRFRLAACALVAVVAWSAAPHLNLLLVPAYPTSFYHSPSGFSSASIAEGDAVYVANCVACHGASGRGDGPAAHGLPVPPADLTAAHLWMHSDGELFWWLSHGMQTPEGQAAMPGFAAVLDEDERWAVIDFIRARNAGDTMHAQGHWVAKLRAPGLSATCGDTDVRLADLRGKYVLLRFGATGRPPRIAGLVTVVFGPASPDAGPQTCASQDETVLKAYATVAGLEVSQMAGTDFLIDDQGWLRAMQRAGDAAPWSRIASLDAEIQALRTHPVADAAPMQMPVNMKM